jgi:hypothetical protein
VRGVDGTPLRGRPKRLLRQVFAVASAITAVLSLDATVVLLTLAAVLANLINNLPAVLVLLPLATPAGPGAVLAVLLGVNIGPNLTNATRARGWQSSLPRPRMNCSRRRHTAWAVPAGGPNVTGVSNARSWLRRRGRIC